MDKELAKTENISGLVALGEMSDDEFTTRIAMLRRSEQRVSEVYQNVLTKGYDDSFDLMKFKGDSNKDMKPFLTQNGANTTMRMFGLIVCPGPVHVIYGGDVKRDGKYLQPPLTVRVEMFLHEGNRDGPCVGSAWGVANSYERKYRYRNAEKECPECKKSEGQLRVSRNNDRYREDQHFYCFVKIGGCGAQFAKNDPRIVDQKVGLIDNPDPMDLEETLTRIAEKRGGVAVVARHTGLKRYVNIDPEAAGWDRVRPSGVTVEADFTLANDNAEAIDGTQQAKVVLDVPETPTPEPQKEATTATETAVKARTQAKVEVWPSGEQAPLEWHDWISAALGIAGDKSFKQKSLEALSNPKLYNAEKWSQHMLKLDKTLKEQGIAVVQLPDGVFQAAEGKGK